MTANNSQVPWTDEQWARVNEGIQEEASRARVAATFLPLYGPLSNDTDFVRSGAINYFNVPPPDFRQQAQQIRIGDADTIRLATLQVKVYLRGAQMAHPEMTSVLALFRRAANVLARLEDAVVFNGLMTNPFPPPPNVIPVAGVAGLPPIWEILGGEDSDGLFYPFDPSRPPPTSLATLAPAGTPRGDLVVIGVSTAIGQLEANGYFGPFAVVLGQQYFVDVQTPVIGMILPQDRIIPFLGGGSLHRSSTIPGNSGLVIALGGAPVELVIATDMSLQFLQVTNEPNYLFRVFQKMRLHIKEPGAIATLIP
jgi:uncharacterized linocin/CFP29 family protein